MTDDRVAEAERLVQEVLHCRAKVAENEPPQPHGGDVWTVADPERTARVHHLDALGQQIDDRGEGVTDG